MILRHGYVAQWTARKKRIAAEREALDDVCAARRNGRREGVEEERRRHELAMVAGPDAIRLNEPGQEFVKVVLGNSPRSRLVDFSRFDPRELYATVVAFRARKKAWQSPEGHTVVWWDWEFVG